MPKIWRKGEQGSRILLSKLWLRRKFQTEISTLKDSQAEFRKGRNKEWIFVLGKIS